MKRTRHAVYAGLVLAALLVSVYVFKRYLPYTGVSALPKTPPAVVMSMDGVSLVGLGPEGKLWSVKAKHVEVAQNRTTTTLSRITDGKVFSGKNVAFKVSAGKAIYDTGSGHLRLDGGIHIEGRRHKLTARGAVWSPVSQTLSSTGPVTYKSDWNTLTAGRLELDVRKKEIYLAQVRGSVDVGSAKEGLAPEVEINAN